MFLMYYSSFDFMSLRIPRGNSHCSESLIHHSFDSWVVGEFLELKAVNLQHILMLLCTATSLFTI